MAPASSSLKMCGPIKAYSLWMALSKFKRRSHTIVRQCTISRSRSSNSYQLRKLVSIKGARRGWLLKMKRSMTSSSIRLRDFGGSGAGPDEADDVFDFGKAKM